MEAFEDFNVIPKKIAKNQRYVSGDYERGEDNVIKTPASGQGKTFFTAPQSLPLSRTYPHLSYTARRSFPIKEEPYFYGKNPTGGENLKGKINMTKAKYSLAINEIAMGFNKINSLMVGAGIDNDFRELSGSFFIGDSSTPINKRGLSGYKLGIARVMAASLVSGAPAKTLNLRP